MSTRYAVYVVPPAHGPLWRFGSAVLGYDAETGADVPALLPAGFDPARFHALTADPRVYGFHATLKAPFRLAEGRSEADLIAGFTAFARGRSAFVLPGLALRPIGARTGQGGFIALVEPGAEPTPALVALERAAVEGFEPFRSPLTEAETARRRPSELSERQRGHLAAYGYSHVLEDYRFHLTLTGRVPAPEFDPLLAGLADLYATHVPNPDGPVPVDELALFRQRPGERFRVLARAALAPPPARADR